MISTNRHHGLDGRFPTKPPPWKYKTMNTHSPITARHDSKPPPEFYTNKQLQTATNYIPTTIPSSAARYLSLQRPILRYHLLLSHNVTTTTFTQQYATVPPTEKYFTSSSYPTSKPHTTTNGLHHGRQPHHRLAHHTPIRYPSDFESFPTQHVHYFTVRLPSEHIPTPILQPSHYCITIISQTRSFIRGTSEIKITHQFWLIPPSTSLPPLSIQLRKHSPPIPPYTPTPCFPKTALQCAHTPCQKHFGKIRSLSNSHASPPHKFHHSRPLPTTPIPHHQTLHIQRSELQLTPHIRRYSSPFVNIPSPPPQTSRLHPMIAIFLPLFRILTLIGTIHASLQSLPSSVSSHILLRPPPHPPPPRLLPQPSTQTMPTPVDFDPGPLETSDDHSLRDTHDDIPPDNSRITRALLTAGNQPHEYTPDDFADINTTTPTLTPTFKHP